MTELFERARGIDGVSLLTAWGERILGVLVILAIGLWLAQRLPRLVDRVFTRARLDAMFARFLHNLLRAALTVLVWVAALDYLGVPSTSLFAIIGAAGIAIGLALRDSLANIAAGVMLITLRPFRNGDAVEIAGQQGEVEQVGIFLTTLRTFSNHQVTLPNRQITDAPIINFTARTTRRIEIPVGIGYDCNIAEARAVLLAVAGSHPNVLKQPASDVVVSALGDNSVDLILRAWVATADFASTRSDLVEAVHRETAKAGIGIPFPQRDIHLKLPEGLSLSLTGAQRPTSGSTPHPAIDVSPADRSAQSPDSGPMKPR